MYNEELRLRIPEHNMLSIKILWLSFNTSKFSLSIFEEENDSKTEVAIVR